MANIKITDLTAYTDPASTDVLPIVDVGSDVTKKVSIADLLENAGSGTASAPGIAFDGDSNTGIYRPGADQVAISTNGTQRLLIEADGDINIDSGGVFYDATNNRLAIGTTSPGRVFEIKNSAPIIRLTDTDDNYSEISANTSILSFRADEGNGASNSRIEFKVDGSEAVRIDDSGRLLVGTSSAFTGAASQYSKLQILGNTSSSASGAQLNLGRNETSANVGNNDVIGRIIFTDNQAGEYAYIEARADGTASVGDYPGRLVFSVTANGASSPTEALRISNDRTIGVFDGGNISFGSTTGTKIGTATSQKIGFYNATPVVQPTTGVAEAAFVENAGGTAVNVDSTFGGYTIQQVVEALQTLGLLA